MLPPLRQLGLDAGDQAFGVLRLRRSDGSGTIAIEIEAIGASDAGAVITEITTVEAQGAFNLDEAEIGNCSRDVIMDSDFDRSAFLRIQPGECH